MKSTSSLAMAAALLASRAHAFWRMPCHGSTGLARLDPLMEPGTASNHAHLIHGGNNFGMTTTYEDLVKSDCTTCAIRQDKSAYWTPSLHFIHDNGTAEVVKQTGAILVYYLLEPDMAPGASKEITAFPKGFRMFAGDPRRRNFTGPVPDKDKSSWGPEDKTQASLAEKATGFNCLNYQITPAEPTTYRHFLPDKAYLDQHCANGTRTELFFPSCWDGKNKDSDDHKSHMAYPDLVNTGACPETHPVKVPTILFETIWETQYYHDAQGQFALAMGDPTGYGYHGDMIMGWEGDVLERAVKQCTSETGEIEQCPVFTEKGTDANIASSYFQTDATMGECKFNMPEALKDDNCEGPADGLCGNVQLQYGPEYATLKPGNGEKPSNTPPPSATPVVPTLSYTTPKSNFHGISVLNVNGNGPKPEQPTTIEAPSAPSIADPPPPVVTPTEAPSAPSIADPPPPVVTPAAEAPSSAPPANIVTTSTYTSAGTVYEVAIEEVAVYVTVDAPAKHRRHLHHRHAHALLGPHH